MKQRTIGRIVFFWLFVALGAVSGLYGALCWASSPGFKSAAWIWFVVAAFFLLWALYLFLREKQKIRAVPKAVVILFASVLSLLLAWFVILETCVLINLSDAPENSPQYVVVLGAHVRADGSPTKALRMRIETAANYLKEHPDTMAVCSGAKGNDEPVSEAECIASGLIARGISAERILMEDRSTTTKENFLFVSEMIPKEAAICVCSNNFHLFRSLTYAKSCQLTDVSGLSAPFEDVLVIHYAVREAIAFTSDLFHGRVSLADAWSVK